MKNLVWFLLGVVGGFAAAHVVNKDPRGHELLAQVDARIGEFTDRIGTAYRDQEARFADGPVTDTGISDTAATVRDAAADIADAAANPLPDSKTSN